MLLHKTSTLIAGCLLSAALCAQPDSSRIVVPVAKATLLAPGFSYEMPTGRQQTLLLHAFASPSFSLFWGAGSGPDASFTLRPKNTPKLLMLTNRPASLINRTMKHFFNWDGYTTKPGNTRWRWSTCSGLPT